MKITNKVTDVYYTQWIEKFVNDVIVNSKIECQNAIIDYIEDDNRIIILIDGKEYDIRMWNFHEVESDTNGMTCAEDVHYSLFEMVTDVDITHGKEICTGNCLIRWQNQ